ncbi:hypothetical protein HKD37_19G052939 [Glycine soja]
MISYNLAQALHFGEDIYLGKFLLASIYKVMDTPESLMIDVEDLQRETYPLDVDPFSFIDVCFSNSMPSKVFESSHNRPFTHFNKAEGKFQRLVFDQPLEDSLSNPDYKSQLQQSKNEVFKFNDLVVDEIHKEIESFPNVFNNVFEAHQLHKIVDIEPSTEEEGKKLVQAREGFQKAKEKIMLIQGLIEKTEKVEAMLVRKKEELMVLLKLIQEELRFTRLKLQ